MAKPDTSYRPTVDALLNLFFNAVREKFAHADAQGLSREEVDAIFTYCSEGSPELDSYYRALFENYSYNFV